jgi:ribonucleoside-triphosphate reductase
VSFLPRAEHNYKLAPWEEISQKEYDRRAAKQKPFDPELLRQYESGEDHDLEQDCDGGACPIR